MSETETLSLRDARDLLFRAFTANGVPEAAARSTADALVAAEAEGQVGHGFSRLEDYVAQARSGKIVAGAEVTITRPAPTTLLVDAGHGFAYPALERAIDEGIAVAQELGTAAIAVTRSHHCGALSIHVERAAKAGLVAMMVVNAPAAIAPWGGKSPLFGTNPIAFATPRAGTAPLVIDLSLSKVARGKVMNAKKAGKPIPKGWALDAAGNPTTDAEAALGGTMVPIGEAKGTALALMVEILSAVMTGAALSTEAGSFFSADGPPPGVGQFLALWRPPEGAEAFTARLAPLLAQIETMEGARLPGTRRLAALDAAQAHGIAVPRAYLDGARRLAATHP
ncbi:Ldh family oxidoreductase [Dinoroseobacter sp. PD6]|uniref:Ldh family oxidoreductase n=1 Tax=Dinoroseobacter sp. PD6 TaxID=3028384 RepID=UPI00237B2C96|nr:Ldh family oxidoreductase [Dinoroseobacter sp. PD6]MDD9715122.1 Ldh family oxidoreductase [Dinoroseobacter sp. PD6]